MLSQFGVRRFTAPVYPHEPGMAAWLNQWGDDRTQLRIWEI
jgi:uncharacterized protein